MRRNRTGALLVGLVTVCGGWTPLRAQQDQAATVIAAARAALGGESRITGVRTFIATGRTRQIRGNALVPVEFEIQVALPDKYSRRDEFPAQDAGPSTTGFDGNRLVQIPAAPAAAGRPGAPPPTAAELDARQSARVSVIRQEFARLLLGMFAGTTPALPVTFTYAGQAEAPQGKADVLDVAGERFAARLFIDAQSHLPLMVTWSAPPEARRGGPPPGTGPAAAPEQRLYFADYRQSDGLLLPFRLRRAVGAETIEETTFDRFRINSRIDPRRFDSGN